MSTFESIYFQSGDDQICDLCTRPCPNGVIMNDGMDLCEACHEERESGMPPGLLDLIGDSPDRPIEISESDDDDNAMLAHHPSPSARSFVLYECGVDGAASEDEADEEGEDDSIVEEDVIYVSDDDDDDLPKVPSHLAVDGPRRRGSKASPDRRSNDYYFNQMKEYFNDNHRAGDTYYKKGRIQRKVDDDVDELEAFLGSCEIESIDSDDEEEQPRRGRSPTRVISDDDPIRDDSPVRKNSPPSAKAATAKLNELLKPDHRTKSLPRTGAVNPGNHPVKFFVPSKGKIPPMPVRPARTKTVARPNPYKDNEHHCRCMHCYKVFPDTICFYPVEEVNSDSSS